MNVSLSPTFESPFNYSPNTILLMTPTSKNTTALEYSTLKISLHNTNTHTATFNNNHNKVNNIQMELHFFIKKYDMRMYVHSMFSFFLSSHFVASYRKRWIRYDIKIIMKRKTWEFLLVCFVPNKIPLWRQ